jgi:hypothetical protein
MVQARGIAEVTQYLERDVLNTYPLWLVYELFRGSIAAEPPRFPFRRARRYQEPVGHGTGNCGCRPIVRLDLAQLCVRVSCRAAAQKIVAMERFVHRKNVEHYRELLKSGQLDDTQHQIILKLLAEEEIKPGDAEDPKPRF